MHVHVHACVKAHISTSDQHRCMKKFRSRLQLSLLARSVVDYVCVSVVEISDPQTHMQAPAQTLQRADSAPEAPVRKAPSTPRRMMSSLGKKMGLIPHKTKSLKAQNGHNLDGNGQAVSVQPVQMSYQPEASVGI